MAWWFDPVLDYPARGGSVDHQPARCGGCFDIPLAHPVFCVGRFGHAGGLCYGCFGPIASPFAPWAQGVADVAWNSCRCDCGGGVAHALLIEGTMEILTKVAPCIAILAAAIWAFTQR